MADVVVDGGSASRESLEDDTSPAPESEESDEEGSVFPCDDCRLERHRKESQEKECPQDCQECCEIKEWYRRQRVRIHLWQRRATPCPEDCQKCAEITEEEARCDRVEIHLQERRAAPCPTDCQKCAEMTEEEARRDRVRTHLMRRRAAPCPPDCQKCAEVTEEEEERDKRNRKDEEEWERARRIERPWLYETQYPMADPPDINYRKLIIYDQEIIDELFEDESLHFTERCLMYRRQDFNVEDDVLGEYLNWTWSMLEDAEKSGDQIREKFFRELQLVVEEDKNEVYNEFSAANDEVSDWRRQRAGQELGIPSNCEEWTTEDKRRYLESSHNHILGWPRKYDIREELEEIDRAKSSTISEDAAEHPSDSDSSPATNAVEDHNDDPPSNSTAEDTSPSASNPPDQPQTDTDETDTTNTTLEAKLEPDATSELHSTPLETKMRPGRAGHAYRSFATLFLTLLVYEFVKQGLGL